MMQQVPVGVGYQVRTSHRLWEQGSKTRREPVHDTTPLSFAPQHLRGKEDCVCSAPLVSFLLFMSTSLASLKVSPIAIVAIAATLCIQCTPAPSASMLCIRCIHAPRASMLFIQGITAPSASMLCIHARCASLHPVHPCCASSASLHPVHPCCGCMRAWRSNCSPFHLHLLEGAAWPDTPKVPKSDHLMMWRPPGTGLGCPAQTPPAPLWGRGQWVGSPGRSRKGQPPLRSCKTC